jgi:CheY-like chemotaxis protein
MHMKGTIRVAIADDQDSERDLLSLALRRKGGFGVVATLENGKEVLAYLDGAGLYADRQRFPIPDILFLDLKMPLLDGFDVLQALRDKSAAEKPMMLVFTASDDPKDRERALKLGADGFYTKPSGLDHSVELLRAVQEAFWSRPR